MDKKTTEAQGSLDLIWGAENIAKVINLNLRQTFYGLENGFIPGKKNGEKWVSSHGILRKHFFGSAEG